MTREDFKEKMETLRKYQEFEDAVFETGLNFWEIEAVAGLVGGYVDLIAEAFNLPINRFYGTELDYFLYEADWGEAIDETEEDCPFTGDLDKLYDYFMTFKKEMKYDK